MGAKGAPLSLAPVLLSNIRLGWKGLLRTNTLAYFVPKSEKRLSNIDGGRSSVASLKIAVTSPAVAACNGSQVL
jgi:hypothetical protein